MTGLNEKIGVALAAGWVATVEGPFEGWLQFGALGVVAMLVWLGHINQREDRKEREKDRLSAREERREVLAAIHRAYRSHFRDEEES